MTYTVAQRTHEIGVRIALGARTIDVTMMIFAQGARITIAGIAAGLVVGLALTRAMESILYGVEPTDPITFGTVGTALVVTALAACAMPASRAARMDPLVALRHE